MSEPNSSVAGADALDRGGAAASSRFARNIPLYYLFQFVNGFVIWVPIWIIFLIDERGLSLTEVGLMEALFWVTIVIAEVPTGAVADRWGRRISLALGGFLFVIAAIMFATVQGFTMLALCYVLMATSMTLYSGSGPALLFDTLRQLGRTRDYERMMGRSQALFTSALMAGTLLGGPCAAIFGMQATILIGAGSMGIAGLIALLLREPPRTEAEFSQYELHAAPVSSSDVASASASRSVFGEMAEGFRIVWRRRQVLWLILFAGLLIVAFEMPSFFLQPFVRSHDVNPTADLQQGVIYSLLLVPGFAVMSLGSLLAAPLSERVGERRALPLLLLVGCAVLVPMLFFDHLAIIAPIAVLAGLHGAVGPIATGYINRRIPSDQRATVLSIYELSFGALMVVIVPLVSASADIIDFRFAYGVALAVLVVFGTLLWLRWRSAHRRAQADHLRSLSIRSAPQAAIQAAQRATAANGAGGTSPVIGINGAKGAYATTPRSRSAAAAASENPSDANSASVS